jgi:tetratricopeptide (TPR) repeat protein
MVCARASRWSGRDERGWLTLAETQATAANDGPLMAQAWLERATAEGEPARIAECPSPAVVTLATAALHRAGSRREQAGVRSTARFKVTWELAAHGDRRGALMELEAAQIDAQLAGCSACTIDSAVGGILRRLGRITEARQVLSGALDTPPVRRVCVLCDLARVHAASGDVDGAAQELEEAFLLTRAHGVDGRVRHVLAARSVLPAGRPARELDDLLRDA